jgi:D-alanyl-D-alanine carboxypeptidase
MLRASRRGSRYGRVMRLTALLFTLLFVLGCPEAVPDPTEVPDPIEEPQASLDPAFEAALLEVLGDQFDRVGTPGLAIAVKPHDNSAWSAALGTADAAGEVPLDRNAPFKVGSVVETFLMGALYGWESDTFSLGRLAHKQLKGFEGAWQVTIRQMLDHTSGVPDYADHPDFDPLADWTQAQLVSMAEELNLLHGPGGARSYSLTNPVYQSTVVTHLAGSPWIDHVATAFLTPLQLLNTSFPTGPDWGGVVPAHHEGVDVTAANAPSGLNGAANAVMSVGNLATWNAALFGDVLTSAQAFDATQSPFHQDNRNFGPAVEILDEGALHEQWGHRVVMSGVSGWVGYRDDLGTSVAVLANDDVLTGGTIEDVAAAIWSVVEDHVDPPAPGDDDDAVDPPPEMNGQQTFQGLQRHDPAGASADPSHTGVVVGGWWDFENDGRTLGRITLTSADYSSGEAVGAVECSFDAHGSFGPGWGPNGSAGSLLLDEFGAASCADWPSADSWQSRIAGNFSELHFVPFDSMSGDWAPTWDGWPQDYGEATTLRDAIIDWAGERPGVDVSWVLVGRIDGLTTEEPQIAPWTFLGWFWR